MTNSVQSSLTNLCKTLEQIGQLEFRVRNSISQVALASNDEFEARYIRDADEAELSLFQPTSSNIHRDVQEPSWSSGPTLTRAHPIADGLADLKNLPKAHSNPGDAAVTRTYLNAIKKLLQVYPQPRLAEHVLGLSSQLETLQESIADLQNTLKSMPNPPRTTSGPAAKGKKPLADATKASNLRKARLEMEDLIQREQLEILALTDMRDEKRTELRDLSEKILRTEIKPNVVLSPRKLKSKNTPSKTKSIMFDANNPFVLSRAESLRRSIQRVKSPRIRQDLPSSGLRSMIMDQCDDNNAPQTPTPKSVSHRQIEKNLSQLRSRTMMHLDDHQMGASTPQKSVRKQSLPSPSVPDHPSESPSNAVEEFVHLTESRLDAVNRLNTSFWKSGTMTEVVLQLSADLKTSEMGDGQIPYQSTISALRRLIESYPNPSITPTQLMEAILYEELLKSLSSTTNNNTSSKEDPSSSSRLEAFTYGDDWCVPLESVKSLLVSACQKFDIDTSLNRSVIYFLVGKAVIRIERRASPISICIC